MKKIIFKNGLTFAVLLLAGAMYGQTNNTIRLRSTLGGSAGGTAFEDNSVTIDAAGLVTGSTNFVSTAAITGTVTIPDARNITIPMRFKTAIVIDQTPGATYGAITTLGGIHRSSGQIGVQTAVAPLTPATSLSTGVDVGEGVTFGFSLAGIPSTVTLQITKISLTTFAATGGESAIIINRQDPTKTVISTGTANPVIDVTALGIFVTAPSTLYEMVTILNNSGSANNWRVQDIEYRLINNASTWNGTAWSNGTPGVFTDATIAGNYSTTTSGSFSALKLTVNSGSLSIDATKVVKVENEVINNAGPSGIIVNSGGGLIQVINSANSNVGDITVNRNSNPLLRLDYTMWSSPVSGTQTLAQFSPLTSQAPNRFYTYDSATDLYANVLPSTVFDLSNAGKGFLIRMPNDASAVTPTAYPGVFTGIPNSGPITLTGLTANKFYSVGNPYPSVIGAASFLAGNPLAGTTLYFWRKTNGIANNPSMSSTGTAYATWTTFGTTSSDGPPNNIIPTANIAVGQGFIVNTGTATSLNFTNTMRPNSSTANFLKTKAAATPNRVWLNLTNATGAFSQALVGYVDGATLGVDNGIDGEYINDSSLALTSNINNKEYTIQGRPTFDASDVVALNFKTAIAGDYTIAIDHFDGLFATGQDIYLADSKTGAETDLKAGPYNFTAEIGVDNSRFTLKYQKTLKVIDSEFNDNSVTVYAKNGTLYVNSGASAISNIKVFDVQGRLVSEQRNVKSTTATISNLGLKQALIVQVSSEDNKVVSKKVVN